VAAPLVALAGGDEFRPPMAEADRYVIQRIGKATVRVAILPTAAAPENAPLAAENGVRYFRDLGSEAASVMIVDSVSANDERLVGELDGVDLVYVAGGDPRFLLETLRDSLVWQRLAKAIGEGCVLAGSSAGAMVVGEAMFYRREWTPALGLLPGICVLPHFQEWGAEVLPELREASRERGIALFGIDVSTACVGWGTRWDVVGPGSATVIRDDESKVFRGGYRIDL
jgi:peptidase E